MPNYLRNWTFKDVVTFLKKNGFSFYKSRGSHYQYKKQTKTKTFLVVVQYHGSKSIPIGTLNSIIRQSGIPKDKWTKAKE